VRSTTACEALGLNGPTTIMLAAIWTCILTNNTAFPDNIDIHYYSREGALHVLDVTGIQCLVGRVRDGNHWAIIDCSGSLACAMYLAD
jgi:hypothetical protein